MHNFERDYKLPVPIFLMASHLPGHLLNVKSLTMSDDNDSWEETHNSGAAKDSSKQPSSILRSLDHPYFDFIK